MSNMEDKKEKRGVDVLLYVYPSRCENISSNTGNR